MQKSRKDTFQVIIIVVFIHITLIFAVYLSLKKNNESKNTASPLSENINYSAERYNEGNLEENSDALMTLTEPAQSLEDDLEAKKDEESENQASQEDKLGKKLEEPTSAASDKSTNDLEGKNKNASVAADHINTNENSSVIQPHKPRESQTVSEDHDKVYVKDNVVLLSRDLPQSDTNSALSSDVAELKYEAERINEELSAAIDEVKKRNQQQIEHREHEKN